MIIKHNTPIKLRIKDLTGIHLQHTSFVKDMLIAKVALEENDLKTALGIVLQNQLRQFNQMSSDDLTKLLNTEFLGGQPQTIRDVIKESLPKPPRKFKNIMEELFPDSIETNASQAYIRPDDIPQNCEILGRFIDTGYPMKFEYFLVKRMNNRLAILFIKQINSDKTRATLFRAGKNSMEKFQELKERLNKR